MNLYINPTLSVYNLCLSLSQEYLLEPFDFPAIVQLHSQIIFTYHVSLIFNLKQLFYLPSLTTIIIFWKVHTGCLLECSTLCIFLIAPSFLFTSRLNILAKTHLGDVCFQFYPIRRHTSSCMIIGVIKFNYKFDVYYHISPLIMFPWFAFNQITCDALQFGEFCLPFISSSTVLCTNDACLSQSIQWCFLSGVIY